MRGLQTVVLTAALALIQIFDPEGRFIDQWKADAVGNVYAGADSVLQKYVRGN